MTNLFDMGGDGVEEYAIGAFGTVSSTPSTGAVIVSLRRRFGQPGQVPARTGLPEPARQELEARRTFARCRTIVRLQHHLGRQARLNINVAVP
jgi:hypothetical protein